MSTQVPANQMHAADCAWKFRMRFTHEISIPNCQVTAVTAPGSASAQAKAVLRPAVGRGEDNIRPGAYSAIARARTDSHGLAWPRRPRPMRVTACREVEGRVRRRSIRTRPRSGFDEVFLRDDAQTGAGNRHAPNRLFTDTRNWPSAEPRNRCCRTQTGVRRQASGGSTAGGAPRAEPATRSKRNRRHSMGPFHSGTRRLSFSRSACGNFMSGLSSQAVQPA